MSQAGQGSSGGSRKISFNVSDQYDIQDVIGEGAYGVVWYEPLSLPGLFDSRADRTLVLHSTSHLVRRLPSRRSLHSIIPCFACELYEK